MESKFIALNENETLECNGGFGAIAAFFAIITIATSVTSCAYEAGKDFGEGYLKPRR